MLMIYPKKLSESIEKDMPGALNKLKQQKGNKVTIRACATRDLLDLAQVSSDDGYGCTEVDEIFGFTDLNACLCENDCD